MPVLDLTLTVSTEDRGGRWAAYVNELNFFAYGETEEEAVDRVNDILNALGESLGDISSAEAYLTDNGVAWLREPDSEEERLIHFGGIEVPDAFAV